MSATLAANLVPPARGSRLSSHTRSNTPAASTDRTTFEATLKGLRGQPERSADAAESTDAAPDVPAANTEAAKTSEAAPKTKAGGAHRRRSSGRDGQAMQPTEAAPADGPAATGDEAEAPAVAMIPIEAGMQADVAVPEAELDLIPAEQAEGADPEGVDAEKTAAAVVTAAGMAAGATDGTTAIDDLPVDRARESTVGQHRPTTASRVVAEAKEDSGDETAAPGSAEEAGPADDRSAGRVVLDLDDAEPEASAPSDAVRIAAKAAMASQPARQVADSSIKAGQTAAATTVEVAGDTDGSPQQQAAEREADADAFGPQEPSAGASAKVSLPAEERPFDQVLQRASGEEQAQVSDITKQPVDAAPADKPVRPPLSERAFAQANHDRIVTNVRTQLMPNGGSMQIRLNPDNLGAMNITVRVVDGVLSAAFQTTSDEATRLVSHTLSQLKSALETQGVTVDRIQVQQAPREAQASRDDGQQPRDNSEQRQHQQESFRQQQERRQLLNRMWEHLAGGGDPLDLVA